MHHLWDREARLSHHSIFARIMLLGMAVILSGCSLGGAIGGKPTAVIYELTASDAVTKKGQRLSSQLIITLPKTWAALSSNAIAARDATSGTISYLPIAEWADELPVLVQSQILRAFENAGALGKVGVPGEQLRSDLLLATDIRAFYLEDSPSGLKAKVSISAKVINDRNGAVATAKVFSASAPIAGGESFEIVSGINVAFAKVLNDLVSWATRRY